MANSLGFISVHNARRPHTQTDQRPERVRVLCVLKSRFMVMHVSITFILSFVIPFIFFSLVIVTSKDKVQLKGAQSLSILITTPFISSILPPLLLPLTWPEASAKDMIPLLDDSDFHEYTLAPCRTKHDAFRFGFFRNVIIGIYASILWLPFVFIALIIIPFDTVDALAFVLSVSVYTAVVTVSTFPFTTLMYCTKENNATILNNMHSSAHATCRRMCHRIIYCVCC